MFTPTISNISFKAICKGQYQELKNISAANGMSSAQIKRLENNIQSLFPDNNNILDFNILGNINDFKEIVIKLKDKNNNLLEQIECKNIFPQNIKLFSRDEAKAEKAKIFTKVVKAVKNLKNKYEAHINTEKLQDEKDKIIHKSKNIVDNSRSICVISPYVNIIKNISIDAGFSSQKANEMHEEIKKILSDKKYDSKIFYLKMDETLDIKGRRQYVIHHGITNNLDFTSEYYNATPGIFESIISDGTTEKDRRELFKNLYNIIKNRY